MSRARTSAGREPLALDMGDCRAMPRGGLGKKRVKRKGGGVSPFAGNGRGGSPHRPQKGQKSGLYLT